MKKYIFLPLLAIIILASCNQKVSKSEKETKQPKKPTIKAEIEKLNQLLAQYNEKSQTFQVSGSKTSTVEGKEGTIIYINPTDLETESEQAIQDSIEVELKELLTRHDFLKANTQTVSNGKMLVSGGAYYIGLKSKGQNLKLKRGKTLKVVLPRFDDDKMFLFYGERDSLETMNWKEYGQQLITKVPLQNENRLRKKDLEADTNRRPADTTLNRGFDIDKRSQYYEKASEIYEPIELKKMGWINCDRFYDIPDKEKTNISFAFESKDSVEYAKTFLVFEDINSMMGTFYINTKDVKSHNKFSNIPLNHKVKFIAITQKNNEVYAYETSFAIKPNQKIDIKLSKYGNKELSNLFK